jgi:hypothetical protein
MITRFIYQVVGRNLCIKIFFACLFSSCSSSNDRGMLNLFLVNKEIRISHIRERAIDSCAYNCGDIKFKLVNTSNENIILYDFNRFFQFAELSGAAYCDSLWGSAEKFIYLYKQNGEQVIPTGSIPDSINWKPQALKRQFEFEKVWFRNSKQLIKSGETIEFSQNVNFRDFYLVTPGIYNLKLLYYQHNVSNYVTQEQVEEDVKRYDAYFFKGCLWSNSVKLIVE